MFDMGFLELALIAGIALIVLGPERLPVAARTVGRYIGQVRRFVGNFQRQIEQETRLEELNRKIMDDTKGQTFRNNDGSTTEQSDAQSAAVARAKSNRSAEAERARRTQDSDNTKSADPEPMKAGSEESTASPDHKASADNSKAVEATDKTAPAGKQGPKKPGASQP